MSLRARAGLGALVVSLVGAGALLAPAPAGAAAASGAATAGVCKDATGVTVVVDMSALGGDVIVRCARGSGFSGLDALKKAGFSVTGTQQSGAAYVCRIQGRPSATETLPVQGKPDYKEACVVTPPTTAYWGYWYAKNGGSWTYSNTGASSHTVIKGGFEGWAFSLNRQGNPPRPAYTPTRPKAPTPPSQPSQPAPTGGADNGADTPGAGGSGGSGSNSGSASTPGSNSPTQTDGPGPGTSDDTKTGDGGNGKADKGDQGKGDKGSDGENPEATSATDDDVAGTTDDVQVTGELPEDPSATDESTSSSSAVPTLIGVGLLVVLGGGAGYTAWRRSHRG